MADPISVIGLVSGIITFVDFGFKVVSRANQIRESGKGTIQEVDELNTIVQDVRRLNIKVKDQIPSGQKPSDDEECILKMVDDCETLCDQLHTIVSKLAVRNSSSFEAFRVAVRAWLKKSDIQELHRRLGALDRQIRVNIQFLMQEDHHTSLMSRLREVETLQQDLGIEQSSKLDAVKDEIMRLTDQNERSTDKQLETQAAMLTSLVTKLSFLQNEHLAAVEQVQVLESLYFPEIRRRYDQIPEAEQRTNQWVYDPSKTAFTDWLESTRHDDGLFYIFGKAGSGKSTLMKHVYEAKQTEKSLKKWAGAKQLNISSFYFWNQGSEMQKTEIGLFQSLLYQILRAAPHFAPIVASNRLHYEDWDMKTLKAAFELITRDPRLDSKYCFFIDGLDEYEGDESDVIGMLKTLSFSGHIKICASSRPGRIYERFVHENILHSMDRMFDIAHYTKADMQVYVHTRLHSSDKFRELAYSGPKQETIDPTCKGIIEDITNWANGVWLWVFFVTREIVQQVERDESITKLRKIVDDFPADLEVYFERIIQRIDDLHKEEMAQTFLVTMDELQPLPLYAFHLLERDRVNPNYAVEEAIRPIVEHDLIPQYERWKSRVRNRCGDLLIVDSQPHPVFLSHSVDFLHRTVRDFLRDRYEAQLRKHLKATFDPLISLCKICLCFLKGLPNTDFRDRKTVNRIIGLTDELLYYAHEVERQRPNDNETPLVTILDNLDQVNSYFAKRVSNHWTHARDLPRSQGYDNYVEGGQCNFLALAVQARLVKYVRAKLEAKPARLQKGGRPLLDYALRPLRGTPITMPYHSARDDPSVDVDMVELLLSKGADPNQPVHLNNGETVWGLFLISMHSTREECLDSLKKAWFRTCLLLIRAGAKPDYKFVHKSFEDKTVADVVIEIFGPEEAATLETRMEACRVVQKAEGSLCCTM